MLLYSQLFFLYDGLSEGEPAVQFILHGIVHKRYHQDDDHHRVSHNMHRPYYYMCVCLSHQKKVGRKRSCSVTTVSFEEFSLLSLTWKTISTHSSLIFPVGAFFPSLAVGCGFYDACICNGDQSMQNSSSSSCFIACSAMSSSAGFSENVCLLFNFRAKPTF